MRAFLIIGAVVALFWAGVFVWFFERNETLGTGREVACRDEQILLSVGRNQGVIQAIQQEPSGLVVIADWLHWGALTREQKKDIGMAAWCVQSNQERNGIVLIKSGSDEIARVENGVWREI